MNIKLKRHTYTSKGEKIKHFFGGLFGWGAIGGASVFYLSLFTGMPDIFIWIVVFLFIGLFVYFTLNKYWVAVGLTANVLINLIFWSLTGFPTIFGFWLNMIFPFPISILLALMQ